MITTIIDSLHEPDVAVEDAV